MLYAILSLRTIRFVIKLQLNDGIAFVGERIGEVFRTREVHECVFDEFGGAPWAAEEQFVSVREQPGLLHFVGHADEIDRSDGLLKDVGVQCIAFWV